VKIRDLLRRCLHKDPHQRLRDIGDARIEIEEALAEPAGGYVLSRPSFASIGVALAAALAGGIVTWSLVRPTDRELRPVSRFALPLPPDEALTHLNDPVVALTADGTHLVYVGGNPTRLYVRPLDRMTASPISGTEDAITTFSSPDGQWVGFYGRGKLEKVSITGGAPVALCDAPNPWGASWGDGDSILFAPQTASGLFRVSAAGGDPLLVTTPDPGEGEVSHRWPEFLPGGKAALFTIWSGSSQGARVAVLDVESSEHKVLIEGGSFARYVAGHLVYVRDGRLSAAPFDLERLEITGPSVPLSVDVLTRTAYGSAQFAFSREGSLVYVPGASAPERTLVWVDRNGASRPLTGSRRDYEHPRLSPDGKRLAVTTWEDKAHLSVYDLERDALTRLSGPEGNQPIWSPDGGRITYRSAPFELVWRAADGSGPIEKLASLTGAGEPSSWSPDGKALAFTDVHPSSGADIWVLSLDGAREPRPFVQTNAAEAGGAFSPDGRWIAYDSKESGRLEVYVQPFPGPGGRWQVSTEGGRQAHWAKNGREIFYRSGDKMMVVEVETNPSFRVSRPELLFEGNYAGGVEAFGSANYDVTADGRRFVMIRTEEETAPTEVHVVLHWAEELKGMRPPPGSR
jgi:serine/threonine-protein kinase